MAVYGSAYTIGGGQYRAGINAYITGGDGGTANYKVSAWGELKNVDGWSSYLNELWLGWWDGSKYVWVNDGAIETGTISQNGGFSSDWAYTNFDQSRNWSESRSHSDKTLWFTCWLRVGREEYSKAEIALNIPARTHYTLSYNANGGTGAPSSHYKWYNETTTLWDKNYNPKRSSTTENGATITFNYNYSGVSNTSQVQKNTRSYSFKTWNTASNGTGTNYFPGAEYVANAAATFYAQWNSSVTKGKITCPTPTRSGFTFLGWGTSASTTTVTYSGGASITPSSNATYYAIWRANLSGGYNMRVTSTATTWKNLVDTQKTSGTTLYGAGGQYGGWAIDSSGYVTVFGKRIKLNGSSLVKGTDKPVRGGNYKYYV